MYSNTEEKKQAPVHKMDRVLSVLFLKRQIKTDLAEIYRTHTLTAMVEVLT